MVSGAVEKAKIVSLAAAGVGADGPSATAVLQSTPSKPLSKAELMDGIVTEWGGVVSPDGALVSPGGAGGGGNGGGAANGGAANGGTAGGENGGSGRAIEIHPTPLPAIERDVRRCQMRRAQQVQVAATAQSSAKMVSDSLNSFLGDAGAGGAGGGADEERALVEQLTAQLTQLEEQAAAADAAARTIDRELALL